VAQIDTYMSVYQIQGVESRSNIDAVMERSNIDGCQYCMMSIAGAVIVRNNRTLSIATVTLGDGATASASRSIVAAARVVRSPSTITATRAL
jgi:hypothetical protein